MGHTGWAISVGRIGGPCDCHPVQVNAVDKDFRTPLRDAVDHGQHAAADVLAGVGGKARRLGLSCPPSARL